MNFDIMIGMWNCWYKSSTSHPDIEALFTHKEGMEITSDCVATWADGTAWGIRTKIDKRIRKNIIIGIYGGIITSICTGCDS